MRISNVACSIVLAALGQTAAGQIVAGNSLEFVVFDEQGAAARSQTPVSSTVDAGRLRGLLQSTADWIEWGRQPLTPKEQKRLQWCMKRGTPVLHAARETVWLAP
jgi:hypothetical protein